MGKIIAKPLDRVKKIAADFEIQRSQFKRIALPDGDTMMQVVVSPGSRKEIAAYRMAVANELARLPSEAQPYFLVDAQRWQDQVLNPVAKPLVLYVQLTRDPQMGGERVYYWTFESLTPGQFGLDESGRMLMPAGQPAGPGKRWFGKSYKPPERYRHLVGIR